MQLFICSAINKSTNSFRLYNFHLLPPKIPFHRYKHVGLKDKTKDFIYISFPEGCGHCKALAPTYEQLGEAFAKSDDVVIAKVDADSDKALNSRFSVSGFPTLKFFVKGSTSAEE